MLGLCSAAAALLLLPLSALGLTPPAHFINTAIAKSIELSGSTTHTSTSFTVQSLVDGAQTYYLAYDKEEESKLGWLEVKVKGAKSPLTYQRIVDDDSEAILYSVTLPTALSKDATTSLTVSEILLHRASPLPASIAQKDPQYLLWSTPSPYVTTPYDSTVMRVKIRAPTPTILSHSNVPKAFTRDNDITRSGATLTLGPFYNVPATTAGLGIKEAEFKVHYEYNEPVISLRTLKRSVEVSHWGSNLNVQDEMNLVNDGPALKGHFARIEYQQSKHFNRPSAQILSTIDLHWPSGVTNPYFYDTIGNVSTSNFRPSPPASLKTARATAQGSLLELRPRYPLLGGWNYSFTVGFDQALSKSVKVDKETGVHVLGFPFMTSISDVAVDDAEVTVILPEGATDVEVVTPFEMDEIKRYVHTTYLDTLGRPAILLKRTKCTEKHDGMVYVSYKLPIFSFLQKPLAITVAALSVFGVGSFLKRYGSSK